MPIKNNINQGIGSDPLPYCLISRPKRSYNMSFDNCFSPQAKSQTQIYSPNKPSKANVSYPYYMPEDWFTVAPPMGIEVEEGEKEEDENIGKISRLSIPMELPPETLVREMEKMNRDATTRQRGLTGGYSTNRGGHRGPVEELTHRLERFKIKTLNVKKGEEHK